MLKQVACFDPFKHTEHTEFRFNKLSNRQSAPQVGSWFHSRAKTHEICVLTLRLVERLPHLLLQAPVKAIARDELRGGKSLPEAKEVAALRLDI